MLWMNIQLITSNLRKYPHRYFDKSETRWVLVEQLHSHYNVLVVTTSAKHLLPLLAC